MSNLMITGHCLLALCLLTANPSFALDQSTGRDIGPPVANIKGKKAIEEDTAVPLLKGLIAKDGSITFRSWSGKLQGTDNDTDIMFLADKRVRMIEYGYVVNSYEGSYRIDKNGEVTVKLNGIKHEWPVMLLRQDSTSLLLRPKDPKIEFVIGNRGGATTLEDQGSYWPFRPILARE